MGSGSGQQTSTTQSTSGAPVNALQPIYKGLLGAALNYAGLGSSVPASWYSTPGFSFNTGIGNQPQSQSGTSGLGNIANIFQSIFNNATGGGSGTGGVGDISSLFGGGGGSTGGGGGNYAGNVASGLLSPIFSGSNYLQSIGKIDPSAILGMGSPAASSQLAWMYPNLAGAGTTSAA